MQDEQANPQFLEGRAEVVREVLEEFQDELNFRSLRFGHVDETFSEHFDNPAFEFMDKVANYILTGQNRPVSIPLTPTLFDMMFEWIMLRAGNNDFIQLFDRFVAWKRRFYLLKMLRDDSPTEVVWQSQRILEPNLNRGKSRSKLAKPIPINCKVTNKPISTITYNGDLNEEFDAEKLSRRAEYFKNEEIRIKEARKFRRKEKAKKKQKRRERMSKKSSQEFKFTKDGEVIFQGGKSSPVNILGDIAVVVQSLIRDFTWSNVLEKIYFIVRIHSDVGFEDVASFVESFVGPKFMKFIEWCKKKDEKGVIAANLIQKFEAFYAFPVNSGDMPLFPNENSEEFIDHYYRWCDYLEKVPLDSSFDNFPVTLFVGEPTSERFEKWMQEKNCTPGELSRMFDYLKRFDFEFCEEILSHYDNYRFRRLAFRYKYKGTAKFIFRDDFAAPSIGSRSSSERSSLEPDIETFDDSNMLQQGLKDIIYSNTARAFFREDNAAYLQGPLGESAKRLITAATLAPLVLLSGRIDDIDKYDTWYRQNLHLWEAGATMSWNVLSFCYNFVSIGLPYLITGDPLYLHPTQSWDKWIQVADEIQAIVLDPAKMSEIIEIGDEEDVIGSIDTVIQLGNTIWLPLKGDKSMSSIASRIQSLRTQLYDCRRKISAAYTRFRSVAAPFSFILVGPSSIGKTSIQKMFISIAAGVKGLDPSTQTYLRNPTCDHDNGYIGQQILILDDLGANNPENNPDTSLQHLLTLQSELPTLSNQADLPKKDTIFFNFKIIAASTNFADYNAKLYFLDRDAPQRRFQVHIYPTVKSEFTDSGGKALDPRKVNGEQDIHYYEFKKFVVGTGLETIKYMKDGVETPASKMNIFEAQRLFKQIVESSCKDADKSVIRNMNLYAARWCNQHDCLNNLCGCGVVVTDIQQVPEPPLTYENNIKNVRPLSLQEFSKMEGNSLFRCLILHQQNNYIKPQNFDVMNYFKEKYEVLKKSAYVSAPVNEIQQGRISNYFKSKLGGCVGSIIKTDEVTSAISETIGGVAADIASSFTQEKPFNVIETNTMNLITNGKSLISNYIETYKNEMRTKLYIGLGVLGAALLSALAIYTTVRSFQLVSRMTHKVTIDEDPTDSVYTMNVQGASVKKIADKSYLAEYKQIDTQLKFPEAPQHLYPKERVNYQQSITPHVLLALQPNQIVSLHDKIRVNLYKIDVFYEGMETSTAHALFIRGNVLVTNKHNFINQTIFRIRLTHISGDVIECTVGPNNSYAREGSDVMFINVPGAPHKSLFKDANALVTSDLKVNYSSENAKLISAKDEDKCIIGCRVVGEKSKIEMIKYVPTRITQIGDCGCPIVDQKFGLIGIHCAVAVEGTRQGLIAPICKEDYKVALDHFEANSELNMHSIPDHGIVYQGLGPLNKRSFLNHAYGSVHVLGSVGTPSTMKSKIRKSLLHDLLPDVGVKIPHMEATVNDKGEYVHPVLTKLRHISNSNRMLNPIFTTKVDIWMTSYLESCVSWDTITPCSLDEAVMGVAGTTSGPMNLSTSAGIGFNVKTKRQLIEYIEELSDDRIFNAEVLDQVRDTLRAYQQGNLGLLPSKWFYKDELISLTKENEGRQRIVSVTPFVKLLLSKICFKKIFLAIRASPNAHLKVGMNAASIAWSTIPEKLKKLDPKFKRLMDSDYVMFDAYIIFLDKILALFIKLLKNNKYFNTKIDWGEGIVISTNEILHGLASDITYYPLEVLGELIVLFRTLESGADETAEFNSTMETYAHYLIFLVTFVDTNKTVSCDLLELISILEKCPDPNVELVLANYGDDNVDTCSVNVAEFYTPKNRGLAAASIGLPITDARKNKELAYAPLEEITFLKRKFIWNTEANAYFAPLEEKSIIKMMKYVKGDSDTLATLTYNNVRDGHRNYFMHGREVFEARTIWLKGLLDEIGILELYDQEWPTFDTLLADFKRGELAMAGI